MATQLPNADAHLVSIQDLMGHRRIRTTQRYASVSNVKMHCDYEKAMAGVLLGSGHPRRSRW
jgi:site-specific recombinase XerD